MTLFNSQTLIVAASCLAFFGCGENSSTIDTAEMKILLTDAPGDFEKVPIEIAGIQAYWQGETCANKVEYQQGDGEELKLSTQLMNQEQAGEAEQGKWIDIPVKTKNVELLKLQNGLTEEIGAQEIPSGYYHRLRLVLAKAQVVAAGQTHELVGQADSPNSMELSYKFQVKQGDAYGLTLDLDAQQSIQKNDAGQYVFKPALKVYSYQHQVRSQLCAGENCPNNGAN